MPIRPVGRPRTSRLSSATVTSCCPSCCLPSKLRRCTANSLRTSRASGVRAAAAIWALALSHLVAGELGATPLAILVGAGFMIVLANSLTAPSDRAIEPVEVPA